MLERGFNITFVEKKKPYNASLLSTFRNSLLTQEAAEVGSALHLRVTQSTLLFCPLTNVTDDVTTSEGDLEWMI